MSERRKRRIVGLFFVLCFVCALFFPGLAAGLQRPTLVHRIALLLLRFSAATFLLAGMVGVGSALLRALRLRTEGISERVALSLGVGICAVVYVLFFLAALHLLYPAITKILLVGFALIIFVELRRTGGAGRSLNASPVASWLCLGLLVLLFIPPTISALAPPYSWDAQVYHLFLPKKFLQHHGFAYLPLNIYSNMPFNLDLLYLLAMSVADDVVAQMMHLALSFALCLGLYAFGKRLGSPTLGIIAAVLFFIHPMVNYEAGVAFIDVGLAFFVFLLFYSFWLALKEAHVNWGILMGIFSGFAVGAKYTGALATAAFAILLLLARFIPTSSEPPAEAFRKNFPRIITIYLLISVLLFVPWGVKSSVYTGNPVYPMLYGWFDGRDLSAGQAGWTPRMARWLVDWQHNIGRGRALVDYVLLPFRVFFESGGGYQNFAGELSPLALIFFPLAIPFFRRWNASVLALIAFALYFGFWSFGAQQVRFLIPALPLLALVAASGLDELRKHRSAVFYLFLAIIASFALTSLLLPRLRETLPDTAAVFGTKTKRDFLEPRVRSYACFRELDRIADPKQDRILFLFENMGYYCNFEFLADGMFEASYFVDLALECGNAAAFAQKVRDMGFRYVLVNHNILRDVSEMRRKPLFRDPQLTAEYLHGLSIIEQFISEHLTRIYKKHNSAIYTLR
jgi:hypothetical protein